MLISQGVPPLEASNKGGVGNKIFCYFRAKCVNIAKTVGDTSMVTIND